MTNLLKVKPRTNLKPFEPEQAQRIIKNILDACKDISLLSIDGYRWISLRSGFIAHFSREGFIADFQSSMNLRDNILAYETANTNCNRNIKDVDYPYYRQQCDMYQQILDQLKANPSTYRQKKQIEQFFIEFEWCPLDELHMITLCSRQGIARVYADKQYLLSLANNIHAHLQESDALMTKLP